MGLEVNNVRETNMPKSASGAPQYVQEPVFSDFASKSGNVDFISIQQLWSDDTKALLQHSIGQMGIKAYSPTILKDDNTAIAKSQTHLIDLMKYYEGDRHYYYEAITTPYKDKFGNWTTGFGELKNKYVTQEEAYKMLSAKLEQYSGEVKKLLNSKIGKGTYEALPSSIKEALIDLCYNKGLGKISGNTALMNAIKSKDYSNVVKNCIYVYSGKKKSEKIEDAGLYRRSLSRAILACRDLQGKELEEARKEIDSIYKKALACHQKNKVSTTELEKIYEQFKSGKITRKSNSAVSAKIKIGEQYKSKGLFSIAQEVYKSLNLEEISFNEFFAELKRINGNPESIKIGQDLKIPYVNYIDTDFNVTKNVNAQTKPAEEKIAPKEKTDAKKQEPGFLSKVWGGVKKFFSAIGNFFKGLFSKSESKTQNQEFEVIEREKTTFQKMIDNGATVTQNGDFQIVSQEYEIKKGDSLWNISKQYSTNEELICSDNGIVNKHKISEGQKINIIKLGYKLKDGEDLSKVASKFGLTEDIISDMNNIYEAGDLVEGKILEIPGFIYTVKKGDTLRKISAQVGVSLDYLKKINNLNSDLINPGQKIFVVYNNSDYAVAEDKKKVTIDKTTNTKTEVVDMSSDNQLISRQLLQQKRKINGKVVATRNVFKPTKSGKLSGKTIIVNAGHGYSQAGLDPGTLGKDGVEDEWLVNYDNAMRLKDKLCAQGANVIFLQGHVNLIGKELAKKENKADMFISVHVNSHDKITQDRTQIYSSKNGQKGKKLAGIMESNFDSWISKNEKITAKDKFTLNGKQDYAQSLQANYGVLRNAEKYQNIPSVLWEVAFMVSPKGRERLANPTLMANYADVMTQSVIEYFN